MKPVPVLAPSLFHAGPFAATTPHPRIGDSRGGCAYRFTTYRDYDYAVQDGHFCVQMHHLWFLEWVGAPESTCLLSRAPSEWIRSMTRVQSLDAARQLQREACLITSNLSVLDQYALCLHGMASEMLELVVGCHDFPAAVMDTAGPVPRVHRASIHMEAMGMWRPPHGPSGPARDVVHPGPPDAGYPACTP